MTTSAAMWSMASIILLLAGIAAMLWLHKGEHGEADAQVPAADPLLGAKATPSMKATRNMEAKGLPPRWAAGEHREASETLRTAREAHDAARLGEGQAMGAHHERDGEDRDAVIGQADEGPAHHQHHEGGVTQQHA